METSGADDPVTVYLREVSNVEPLTKDEESRLFRQLSSRGNWDGVKESIARRLIENRLALVARIAEIHSASGVPMLDLIQEGNIGLMNAVRSFAQTPIGNFGDYATACIEKAITKSLDKSK
jgi:DNA-directed RNA polymerase sigma subunit (sigma70/sigma32)